MNIVFDVITFTLCICGPVNGKHILHIGLKMQIFIYATENESSNSVNAEIEKWHALCVSDDSMEIHILLGIY